jgi:hypothetical protein
LEREVFARALVLSGTRAFPFQTIVGYDLRQFEHLELTLEYVPSGKVWGGNRYTSIRLPPELRGRLDDVLAERCPAARRWPRTRG